MKSKPFSCFALFPRSAAPSLHLLHKPAMNKTQIVFSYAGDLWSVPARAARRRG